MLGLYRRERPAEGLPDGAGAVEAARKARAVGRATGCGRSVAIIGKFSRSVGPGLMEGVGHSDCSEKESGNTQLYNAKEVDHCCI